MEARLTYKNARKVLGAMTYTTGPLLPASVVVCINATGPLLPESVIVCINATQH